MQLCHPHELRHLLLGARQGRGRRQRKKNSSSGNTAAATAATINLHWLRPFLLVLLLGTDPPLPLLLPALRGRRYRRSRGRGVTHAGLVEVLQQPLGVAGIAQLGTQLGKRDADPGIPAPAVGDWGRGTQLGKGDADAGIPVSGRGGGGTDVGMREADVGVPFMGRGQYMQAVHNGTDKYIAWKG